MINVYHHLTLFKADNEHLKRSAEVTTLPFLVAEVENEEDEWERLHGPSAWLCAAGNGACTIFMEVF